MIPELCMCVCLSVSVSACLCVCGAAGAGIQVPFRAVDSREKNKLPLEVHIF